MQETNVKVVSSAEKEINRLVSELVSARKNLKNEQWVKEASCKKIFVLTDEEIDECKINNIDLDLANQKKISSIFFPDQGQPVDAAIAICNECPVELQCFEYSLRSKERMGIWGGVAERGRRRIKRQRKIIRNAAKGK